MFAHCLLRVIFLLTLAFIPLHGFAQQRFIPPVPSGVPRGRCDQNSPGSVQVPVTGTGAAVSRNGAALVRLTLFQLDPVAPGGKGQPVNAMPKTYDFHALGERRSPGTLQQFLVDTILDESDGPFRVGGTRTATIACLNLVIDVELFEVASAAAELRLTAADLPPLPRGIQAALSQSLVPRPATPVPAPTPDPVAARSASSTPVAPPDSSAMEAADRAFEQKDYAAAFGNYHSLAAEGNAKAQRRLGYLYSLGLGVAVDDAQALSWYRKSAVQGDAMAQASLARIYLTGQGGPKDAAQALLWSRKAADQGNGVAQNFLGVMYRKGEGVPKDVAQAARWYRLAADQGEPEAQSNLANLYLLGEGVRQDDGQAFGWFRKAAEQGNAFAQYSLGWMYEAGRGVNADLSEALAWYQKGAAQGDANAQNSLGVMYRDGRGIAPDLAQARAWLAKAAAQDDADAERNLGALYLDGQGVKQDEAQGVAWYTKAAAQGDRAAMKALADHYAGKDTKKWQHWLREAARAGDEDAQEDLDWWAFQSNEGQQDAQTLVALKAAARQGNAESQGRLGWLYISGLGVPKDPPLGVQWLERAAAQKHAKAIFSVGLFHWLGQHGQSKDQVLALAYYENAARAGDRRAQRFLTEGREVLFGSATAEAPSASKEDCVLKCNAQCTDAMSGGVFGDSNTYCFVPCIGTCETGNNLRNLRR